MAVKEENSYSVPDTLTGQEVEIRELFGRPA